MVAAANGFHARGVDDECYQMMRNLTQGGRRLTRVAFPPEGGWAVIAQDEFYVRGIDDACFTQLNLLAPAAGRSTAWPSRPAAAGGCAPGARRPHCPRTGCGSSRTRSAARPSGSG
ncbi:hypothetical protein ACFQX6_08505 [Streptosporangium lutulentum]